MTDLRGLIEGILVVIFVACSLGKMNELHDWAKREALKDIKGWPPYHFFPKGYK